MFDHFNLLAPIYERLIPPPDPRVLGELLRVLKPDGRLVIEEPDIRKLPVRIVALLEKLFLMRSHFKSPAESMRLIAEAGGFPTLAREDFFRTWIIVVPHPPVSQG